MKPQYHSHQINLFSTPPHECSYLPDHRATTIFLDPYFPKDARLYSLLSEQGFRRSGEHLYRPQCENCRACISVRVPVNELRPRRRFRRIWDKNRDLSVRPVAPVYRKEHFQLYCEYLAHRHKGGGMDDPTPESYMQFLTSTWSETLFYEFRLGSRLLAVAVLDQLENALSAVYTFFSPHYPRRSLGHYAILWEIREAERLGMDWLYLGYWIDGCEKMQYKDDYQPLEYYANGLWFRKATEAMGQ